MTSINFPNTPADGQVYTAANGAQFYWDATKGVWRAQAKSLAPATVAAVPPANAVSGTLWYNSGDGNLYVYYVDVDSNQWVQIRTDGSLVSTLGYRVDAIEVNDTAQDGRLDTIEALNVTQTNRLDTLEMTRSKSPNCIINGAFDIWQRGTSSTTPADSAYTAADRWSVFRNGSGIAFTVSQQTFTPGAAPVAGYEGQYFYRVQQTNAGTGQTYMLLSQKIEDVRTYAGQTVTLSFWAKSDASRTIPYTELRQVFGGGGSTDISTNFTSYNVTTSWQRITMSVTLPSISGKTIGTNSALQLFIALPFNTTYTLDIWGVQLEAGATATTFRRNAPSIQGELAACQRYYVREYLYGGGAVGGGGVVPIVAKQFKVPMRTTPSYSWISGGTAMDGTADVAVTGMYSSPFRSETSDGMELLFTSSTLGTGRGVTIRGALVQFSAEL